MARVLADQKMLRNGHSTVNEETVHIKYEYVTQMTWKYRQRIERDREIGVGGNLVKGRTYLEKVGMRKKRD